MFSIIIPVYNAEKYLANCIESILSQTYKDFEIILVDDYSTDSCGKICDMYEKKYQNIKVIHKTYNEGALAARITGRRHCNGEYIMHVDSDDSIDNKTLELLSEKFEGSDADLLIFGMNRMKGKQLTPLPLIYDDLTIIEGNKEELFKMFLSGSSLNNLVIKVYKSYLDDSININTGIKINNGDDLLYSLHLITKAKKIVVLPNRLYYYRENPTSITSTFKPIDDIKKCSEFLEHYMYAWKMEKYKNVFEMRKINSCYEHTRRILLENKLPYRKYELEKLADDNEFFRYPYAKERHLIPFKRKLVLTLLYHRYYGILCFVGRFIRTFRRVLANKK